MKRLNRKVIAIWSSVLLLALVVTIFILPVLPLVLQKILLRFLYSTIYLSAILCLDKKQYSLIGLFIFTFVIEWGSGILGFPQLLLLAKCVNVIFFIIIVISLIAQIATAKNVSLSVIVDAVSGYLLLGLIFSIAILLIGQRDPGAFACSLNNKFESGDNMNLSVPVYFSFVTLATLGYGDIVPVEPYTRAFSTFIAVCGQFYIAIIVALLVGKFSAKQNKAEQEDKG